jgi:hypothetical protein
MTTKTAKASRKTRRHGPSGEPQVIGKADWYFEGENTFVFVHEVYSNKKIIQRDTICVPVKMLRKSLARL